MIRPLLNPYLVIYDGLTDISLVTEIPAKLKKAIDIWKKIHMYDFISHAW